MKLYFKRNSDQKEYTIRRKQRAEGTYVQKETKLKRKENSEGSKVFIKK